MSDTGVILSWSSGKDSAWSLHALRQMPGFDVRALITTFNEQADRVAMHAVRRELVRAQANAADLPLMEVGLPQPCSNDDYEQIFGASLRAASEQFNTRCVAFGDLYLQDIRNYRECHMTELGLSPLFPLWERPTHALAREMIAAGVRATLSCVDPAQLDAAFVGREYDESLLADLPSGIDPCGENGEFHTFVRAGPMFSRPVRVMTGETVTREGFCFADILPVS